MLCLPHALFAQSFEVAARFGAGGQPAAVAVGDFNEDTKPDVAVANYAGSSLSILLGTGTGGFGAGTLLSVGSFPLGVVTGDFNIDGHLDLAVANFGSNNVSILLGMGNGTFGPPTSYSTGLGPTTLVAADFNADNKLDLAVANFNGGTVSILRGDGSGAFSLVQSPAAGAGPRGIAAGNLNGDAFPDLVVANFSDGTNSATILLGGVTGFTVGTPLLGAGGAPFAVALAPLNADANLDLVVANSSNNMVSVRFGNGDGTFGSASTYATGTEPRWVVATDLNNDGKLDLAIAGFQSNSVTVRLNDGAGGFPGVTLFGAGASAMAVAAADFNADGAKDLVTANTGGNDVSVLRGDGLGGFKAPVGRPVGGNPRAIASGDFNGDTKRDVVVANNNGATVSVLLATTGTGAFATHVTYTTTGGGPRALGVGRFNADANDDVVVALSVANQVALLTGNGTGALSAPTLFDVGLAPVALVVADFNGDTKPDLAVANLDGGEISILIGNGAGSFAPAVGVAVGIQPNDIAVGDFDADGHPDLAVANFGSGDVSILLGDGVGGFTSAGSVAVGTKPRVLAVADFNEDGWDDLAAANEFLTSQRLAVLLGDGEGGFGAPAQYGIPGMPTNLKVSDTNGDGHADLAVANSDVDSVSILSGNGTGSFGSAVPFTVGDQPTALAVTDLTGDGKPDIAVVNAAQSNNMWLLVNTTIFLKADLELTVDDGQAQTVPGATITYTLTVKNNGPNSVSTVRLEDEVPAAVLSPLFTPSVGAYDVLTGVWSGLTLGTGQSVTMTLEGTVDPLAEGSVSNTASVFPPAGTGDPNLANNTDTDTTILHTLTIGNQTVTEGAAAVFTVTLSATSTQVITVNYATADGTAKAGSDYTSTSGTLTFPPGTVTRTLSVTTLGDALSEATEAFSVVLTGASGALVTDDTGTGTIVDDDPVPMLTIADVSKAEGNSTSSMLVTASLSTASGQTVTADFATAAGTATPGADYTTTTGTLSIPAGSLSGTITVTLVGDTLNETNETFFVNLSGATGANLTDSQALCTILDDDSPPQISVDDVQVVEVDGTTTTAAFTLSLSNPSGQAVTVHYQSRDGSAVAGDDYDVTPASGTVTFTPGTTSALVGVSIHDDSVLESTETFFLDLSAPTKATLGKDHGQAWILDQSAGQRLAFSAARYSGTEASGKATVLVQRTGGTTGTVTVDYQTSDGTAVAPGDYTTTSGTLTFGPGIASRSFMVPIVNDTVVDGAVETLMVSLRNPTGGAALGSISTAQVAITDNDLGGTLAFAVASYSVGEAGPQVTLTVKRTGGVASGVGVSYATVDGTAKAAQNDYTQTSGVLDFAAGVLSQTLTLPILEDSQPEGNEAFTVVLTSPTGGAVLGALAIATVKIVDNESALQFSAPSYTVGEAGRSATFTVTRSGPPAGTVTVDYATAGGSAQSGTDYTHAAGTLSFGPNITTRTFTVPITNDTVYDPGETVQVHLSNPNPSGVLVLGGDATLTIIDNDLGGMLQFSMASYSATEASGLATITVKRTGGLASDVTVNYATSDGSGVANVEYTPSAGSLTFGAGVVSRTFTVPILPVGPKPDRTVNLTLSSPGGGGALGALSSAILTIRSDDPVVEFSSASYSVTEGAPSATITVKRTGLVTPAVSVHYETSDGTAHAGVDYTSTSGSLVLPANVVQKTFTIPILNDPDVESSETVNLTLTLPTGGAVLGARDAAVLTILADDPVVSLAAATYTVSEAAKAVVVTVTRSGSTVGTTTVVYTTSNGTALVGLDYSTAAGTLIFLPNAKTKTISIPILADTSSEAAETFSLTLSNPSTGALLGAITTTVVTITDNDGPGTFAFSAPDYAVGETGPTATITVTRRGGTGGGASVSYAATAGTAVAGENFVATSGTLTFASGETSKTFQVLVLDDEASGGSKTVNLILSNPGAGALGAPSAAVLWIVGP